MPVDDEMALRGSCGDSLDRFDGVLVVAVHEVDLEALRAKSREVVELCLGVVLQHGPSHPQDHVHVPARRVRHDFLHVDGGVDQAHVVPYLPTGVDERVRQAEVGREVDERKVRLGVGTRLERAGRKPFGAPPVPGRDTGLDPREVDVLALGRGERPHDVGCGELRHVVRHHEHAPRIAAVDARVRETGLPLRHAHVRRLRLLLGGQLRMPESKAVCVALEPDKVDARVVSEIAFGERGENAVALEYERQVVETLLLHVETGDRRLPVHRLPAVLHAIAAPGAVVAPGPAARVGGGECEEGVVHRDEALALFLGEEPVRDAVVAGMEDEAPLATEAHFGLVRPEIDLRFLVDGCGRLALHVTAQHLLDGASAPVRRVVGVLVALAYENRRDLRLSPARDCEFHSALRERKRNRVLAVGRQNAHGQGSFRCTRHARVHFGRLFAEVA